MQVRIAGYKYDAPTELQTGRTLCLLLLQAPKNLSFSLHRSSESGVLDASRR